MNLLGMMRAFTIRTRMLGAIAMVLVLLGLLGGAGMLGMFRIHGMSQQFMHTSYAKMGYMVELRAELGAVRAHEKDMIIQYERAEEVRKAHTQWLAAIDRVKSVAERFLKDEDPADDAIVSGISERVDRYRQQFEHIARQLEAGGYDTATTANRMSGKAMAEVAEVEKLIAQLDQLLRQQVDAMAAEEQGVAEQTQWIFVAAVVLTVLVVVPLTLMNMLSICRPLVQARQTALTIAQGDLSQSVKVEGKDEVADLQRALDQMQQSLGSMVTQVRDASGNIATASQEHTSELQSQSNLVCRLLLEKKKKTIDQSLEHRPVRGCSTDQHGG